MTDPQARPAPTAPARASGGLGAFLRGKRVSSLLLIAPMLIFTLALFVTPIVMTLVRAVDNPELSDALPRTSEVITTWTASDALPPNAVAEALIADLASDEKGSKQRVAAAARRLNYEISGLRSVLINTQRDAKKKLDDSLPAMEALGALNPAWAKVDTWVAMRAAMPRQTDFYVLSALDLRRTLDGDVARAAPEKQIYVDVMLRTLKIAAIVTVLCVAVGYPLAALMVSARPLFAMSIVAAVLLPFWTSLLAKTSSWIVILQKEGPINKALMGMGLIDKPLELIFNATGLYIVMVHMLLPFTVLPIYATMKGIPPSFMRASSSLGAHPVRGFLKVYLPMTLPGVGAGALLTFIITVGYYITPSLVGSASEQMLGYFVAQYAYVEINWGLAASLALMLLIGVLALYILAGRVIGIRQIAGLK